MIRGLTPETKAAILETFSPIPIPELNDEMIAAVTLWDQGKGHLRFQKRRGSYWGRIQKEAGFVEYALMGIDEQEGKMVGRRDTHHDPDLAGLNIDILHERGGGYDLHLGFMHSLIAYHGVNTRVFRLGDEFLGVQASYYEGGINGQAFIATRATSAVVQDYARQQGPGFELKLISLSDYLKTNPTDTIIEEVEVTDKETYEMMIAPITIYKGVVSIGLELKEGEKPIQVSWPGILDLQTLSKIALSPIPRWAQSADLAGIKME